MIVRLIMREYDDYTSYLGLVLVAFGIPVVVVQVDNNTI